ncbi:DUF1735 domain-containing protein [Phocaeicola sp.]
MRTKRYFILSMLFIALTMTSCLKDDSLVNWDNAKPVIELPYTKHNTSTTVTAGTEVTFPLYVNYTIADWRNQNEDIVVGLGIDESQIGTTILLPASTYNLPATMTITKQTQLAETELKINTTGLASGTYALPVVIKSVPAGYTISGNFGMMLFKVVIK